MLFVSGPQHFMIETIKWAATFRIACTVGLKNSMFEFVKTEEVLQVKLTIPRALLKRKPTQAKAVVHSAFGSSASMSFYGGVVFTPPTRHPKVVFPARPKGAGWVSQYLGEPRPDAPQDTIVWI